MHRTSYWKTTVAALVVAVSSLLLAYWLSSSVAPGIAATAVIILLLFCFALVGLIAIGGFVCLWRDAGISAGKGDFLTASAIRIPPSGRLSRLGLRLLRGSAPCPGDTVRVKALAEIERTLDADGALDGLPFMSEMKAYCGRTCRVHRRVDKVNDMRHKTGLRRLRGVVSLANLRCSGIDHGGCQAACQFLWKDAWLERVSASRGPSSARERNDVPSPPGNTRQPSNGADTYVCQMTRLWEASAPMSRFDVRQDLRPLLSGNIRFGAYLLIMLTRLFNGAQRLRNGVGFPAMPPPREKGALRPHASNFAEGQAAFVRDRGEISSTLTNSRNKGLWFDSDMIRFCGQFAVVHSRVDKLIHEATGKMVIMKTPCVTLDGIVATGEFLRLCPQHEFIFWREAWLRPGASDDNATAADHMR